MLMLPKEPTLEPIEDHEADAFDAFVDATDCAIKGIQSNRADNHDEHNLDEHNLDEHNLD